MPTSEPVELVKYPTRVLGPEGEYSVRALGRPRADGTWEGWLEFTPSGGGTPLVTGIESTQSNMQALRYWASGLEPIYLEGAFTRAT
jgi:hypothetical protein